MGYVQNDILEVESWEVPEFNNEPEETMDEKINEILDLFKDAIKDMTGTNNVIQNLLIELAFKGQPKQKAEFMLANNLE